jgi:tetratricopeptide (TPR) repeat protein
MNDSQLQQQAAALLNQERYSESIALYEQCIEANPSELSNYWHLGVALLLQGDESLAQAVWLTVFAQGNETDVEAWSRELLQILHAYAFKYFQERKLPLAEKIYQQILDLDSTQLEAYLGLGRLFLSHGEFDRATESLQQALELQPNLSEAHYNLGLCFKNKHQLDRAIEHFKQCLNIDNSLSKAYLNLGICYYEKYAIARAIDCFEKARKLDESFPET